MNDAERKLAQEKARSEQLALRFRQMVIELNEQLDESAETYADLELPAPARVALPPLPRTAAPRGATPIRA